MDRREGHPRQSSLPSSLHPHIVTRPHPQPRSTDPSQTDHSQHGEADGGGGPFDESPYQLRPIAPSLSPSTFGDDSRRTFGLPQRRATDSPEPDDVSDDDDGGHTFRTFMPLPRRTTNRYVAAHSSIPHGLPPIRSIFNAPPLTYAYYAPVRVPLPQGDRDRTLPPSWQEGEAGPSSLSRSRPQQSRPSRWTETRSQTQPETALGERILGLRPFERQTDPTNRADVILRQTHVSDRPEFEGGEYPGRDAATAQRKFYLLLIVATFLTIRLVSLQSGARCRPTTTFQSASRCASKLFPSFAIRSCTTPNIFSEQSRRR